MRNIKCWPKELGNISLFMLVLLTSMQARSKPVEVSCLNASTELRREFPDSKLELSIDTSKPSITIASTGLHRDGSVKTDYSQARTITVSAKTISWQSGISSILYFWFLDRQSLNLKQAVRVALDNVAVGGSENVIARYTCKKSPAIKTLI
jgi:hypothetical protein